MEEEKKSKRDGEPATQSEKQRKTIGKIISTFQRERDKIISRLFYYNC